MTIEEGLRLELSQIPNFDLKVSPVIAPIDIKAPFIVYNRESVDFEQTLSGQSFRAEGRYVIYLVCKDYESLISNCELVKDKLLSLLARNIGGSGPYIQKVTVNLGQDAYDQEAELFRTPIVLNIKY